MSVNSAVLSFAKDIKEYFYSNGEKYIKWGPNDETPKLLVDVLGICPDHDSALQFVTSQLYFDGIEGLDYYDYCRMINDYYIFGGFACQIIKNKGGKPSRIIWLEMDRIRYNVNKDKLGYIKVNANNKKEIVWFPIAENIYEEGIFLFKNYKSRKIYPEPYYQSSEIALDTMKEIMLYHNNNAKNGFSPSCIININSGMDESQQRDLQEQIQKKFTGSNGQKFIVLFNEDKEQATTIERITGDNLDEKFETLQKFIENQIIISHRLTSPQLIGIKAENQGFSKTEYDEALSIFRDVVINSYLKELEYAFGKLLNKEVKIGTYVKQ